MTLKESQETRIALLEQYNETIMEKIDDIIATLSKFDEKLDKALEKKADVWVEKAISWGLYAVSGIIITALLAIIIKN